MLKKCHSFLQHFSFTSTGDVGGQLGLVLGASVITLLEVIDLVIMWVYFWFKGKAKNRSSKQK